MKNFIEKGKTINLLVPNGGYVSGEAVLVGDKLVICVTGGAEGETIAAMTCGVFKLNKAGVAIAQGEKLYYDETNAVVTNVVPGNVFIGYAHAAALIGGATVDVNLANGVTSVEVVENIAAEATADGSDAGTTQALANALKVKVNAILAALKAAGVMVADA